jgi:hypothetical protein
MAKVERFVAIAFACGSGHGKQRVGDPRHRADHYQRAFRKPRPDNSGNSIDRGGVFHRRAAEFHDDHSVTAADDRGSSPFVTSGSLAL